MTATIEAAWRAIKSECERFQEKDSAIKFDEEGYPNFERLFNRHYNDIMTRFMRETTELDSHKQAAIITISCLESDVIKLEVESDESSNISQIKDDEIFIAPQLIAVSVGLSYMNDRLNEALKKKHMEPIDRYVLPIAIACETPYIEIICRLLYYEQYETDMSFNVLELADKYFLLEYINLIQNGIEPALLKNKG